MRRWASRRRVSGVSGFRGAALNQSRSASGVYTGLICYGGVTLYESVSCSRRKRWHQRVSRICDTGYIPLPRSLTRYARSFGCGERGQQARGEVTLSPDSGDKRQKNMCAGRKGRVKDPGVAGFP